jgi:hypothetical protein
MRSVGRRGAPFNRWQRAKGVHPEPRWMLVVLLWYHQEMGRLGVASHAGKAQSLRRYFAEGQCERPELPSDSQTQERPARR